MSDLYKVTRVQRGTKGLILLKAPMPAHAFLHTYSTWVSNVSFSSSRTPKHLLEVNNNNNNNNNIGNLYSALSWRSKRFTTLCGGLCQTAYLGANCRRAVHNLIKENSKIRRCPQNRVGWNQIIINGDYIR